MQPVSHSFELPSRISHEWQTSTTAGLVHIRPYPCLQASAYKCTSMTEAPAPLRLASPWTRATLDREEGRGLLHQVAVRRETTNCDLHQKSRQSSPRSGSFPCLDSPGSRVPSPRRIIQSTHPRRGNPRDRGWLAGRAPAACVPWTKPGWCLVGFPMSQAQPPSREVPALRVLRSGC